ncbi:MAG: indolepyruvate oxidoreductase subunit beta [Kiritimatiellae bacterium]|nr:indolepyruvate oxidoreductase subunit beta [Kiritimatiellia bacterium]
MAGKVTNVVVAGLGGQGVITCSDILAEAAFRAGYDVKKAEVHGMSQRGGFVTSDVRFGENVLSPMVPEGEADYLVVLEDSQIEAAKHLLRPGGVMLKAGDIPQERLPNPRTLNIAMLGMLSAYLDIPEDMWFEAVRANLPEKLVEINFEAFRLGHTCVEVGGCRRKKAANPE